MGRAFAYPPLPWIGARFKFEVREKDGNKVLAKTIENRFFQRATVFMGAPDAKNYTIDADVMSDGNRRKMSEVGVINQRYEIVLKGNEQKIEVNSNLERLRVSEDFKWPAQCLVSTEGASGYSTGWLGHGAGQSVEKRRAGAREMDY